MNDILVKSEPSSDGEQEDETPLALEDTTIISEKPSLFTCPECSQSFKTKSSLHYHQRKYRHCGMEPFACSLCGKEFGIATHLTSHMRTHTKQRPFFCPLEDCDRVYSRIDLVNVHLIKCHKINYKVKSKCFRDGVFCGQVYINGEMRMIRKVIPDKGAASGVEIEMPQDLSAKMHQNSLDVSSVMKSFDTVDGFTLESKADKHPVNSQGSLMHSGSLLNTHHPILNHPSFVSVTNTSVLSRGKVTPPDSSVQSEKCLKADGASHTSGRLTSYHPQGTKSNTFYQDVLDSTDFTSKIATSCNYVNPSLQNAGEFHFGNVSRGSVVTSGGIVENGGIAVSLSKSCAQPVKNGSIQLPSVAIAKSYIGKQDGRASSPLLGTEFPKSLFENNQPCGKKLKKSSRGPVRRPIEIPKLKVKVCIIPNESRYKCPDCEYITDTMPMVILHMRQAQHGGMRRKKYRCQKCSKKFLLKETLCQHLKTCVGPSECDQKRSKTLPVSMKTVKNDVLVASKGKQIAAFEEEDCGAGVRKCPKVEPVDNSAVTAQPNCAIDLNSYDSLATFGDMSNFPAFKSSLNENTEDEKPAKKKMKYANEVKEMEKFKPNIVVKSEKVETAGEQPDKPQGTALPGIGTFFSNCPSSDVPGMQSQTTLPSFQSIFNSVSLQKSLNGFNTGNILNNSVGNMPADGGKSLASIFPWLNVKSVLRSLPDELSYNHHSEFDPADKISSSGNNISSLDPLLTGNPQTCGECGTMFKTLSLLRYHQHKNSHDGYKPYPCTHCDSSFGSKGHLETHLRKHTKEKPYFCPLCHRTFSRVDLVNSHLRLQHNMPIHISGKDVLLPKDMWNSEEENSMDLQ